MISQLKTPKSYVGKRGSEHAGPQIRRVAAVVMAASLFLMLQTPAFADQPAKSEPPLKVGFSVPITGPAAQDGKQVLIALQLWRDDVNAKGGLIGRSVELVYYDDQDNPAKVPGIYRNLITIDNVDLILGPLGTNQAAAAMRVVMEFNKVEISILAAGINRIFSYWRYFSMAPYGSEGTAALSKGFFDLATAQKPRPQTVALLAVDTEHAKAAIEAARHNAAADNFDILEDKTYPTSTTDFAPTVRALQMVNADVLFVAAGQPDTPGIVRAIKESGLKPKLLGGAMMGLRTAAIKTQLGPLLDGIVTVDNFVSAPTLNFPGLADVLKRYRTAATGEQMDPLGHELVPFGYATGQVLAQAVEGTGSLDSDKLAEYMHGHKFETVVGKIEYGKNGEWSEARTVFVQFRHVSANNSEQFSDGKVDPIVWPPQYKTGEIIYPYANAKN
jgi:branched-chain amino acid transport system substrate-binding protein